MHTPFFIELIPTDGRAYVLIGADKIDRNGEIELLFSKDEVGDSNIVYMTREKDGKGWSCRQYQDSIEKPPYVSEALLMMHEVLKHVGSVKPTRGAWR